MFWMRNKEHNLNFTQIKLPDLDLYATILKWRARAVILENVLSLLYTRAVQI